MRTRSGNPGPTAFQLAGVVLYAQRRRTDITDFFNSCRILYLCAANEHPMNQDEPRTDRYHDVPGLLTASLPIQRQHEHMCTVRQGR